MSCFAGVGAGAGAGEAQGMEARGGLQELPAPVALGRKLLQLCKDGAGCSNSRTGVVGKELGDAMSTKWGPSGRRALGFCFGRTTCRNSTARDDELHNAKLRFTLAHHTSPEWPRLDFQQCMCA